jgi:putative transposase
VCRDVKKVFTTTMNGILRKQKYEATSARCGGMDVSDVKRRRYLELENADLKGLVGELSLDNRMLKDVLGKKW